MTKKEKQDFVKVSNMLSTLEDTIDMLKDELVLTRFELAKCTKDYASIRIIDAPFLTSTTKFALKKAGINSLQELVNTPIEDISEIIELKEDMPSILKRSRTEILGEIETLLSKLKEK